MRLALVTYVGLALIPMTAVARADATTLASRSCSIYPFNVGEATGYHLPERYTPRSWRMNKFSVELWLQQAMRSHPWRSSTASDADLVLLEANYSMMCRAGKMFSGRFLWQKMNGALAVPPKPGKVKASLRGIGGPLAAAPPPPQLAFHPELRGSERVPKAFVLTDNECQPPWTGSRRAKGLIELTDHNPSNNDVLAPFVLAKPWWLVGAERGPKDAARPAEVPWSERKLLFFAGHVPKLYIRPTRYLIWKQVRRHPGVTALSATLNCTIGSFSICREAVLPNFTIERSRTYCQDFCASHIMDDFKTALHDAPGHVRRNISELAPPKPSANARSGRCINGIVALRRACRHYRHIDFDNELADMAKSAVNLPTHKYFAHAMGHRFCMAAPGDFVSTPKITEYVAMGAAGGCLPLLVLAGHPERTLPYTRWLDWCSIGFIVSDQTARRDMASVLSKLERVTAEEAAAKRAALLAVRDAFVFRPPKRGAQPSAVDFLLGEMCVAARNQRANLTKLIDVPIAGGSYSRCML